MTPEQRGARRREVMAGMVAVLAGPALVPGPAAAQAWPSRPIRFIVPYPPGGASDVVSRLITKQLATVLATPVVVDNRPGASTMIGAEAGARSAPDGYTLLMASTTTMCVVPTAYGSRTPFDPLRDFTPIGLVSRAPFFVMVPAGSPIKDAGDLIRLAKSKPGQLSYGSNGVGGAAHLGTLLLQRAADIQMTHVPYRSIVNAGTDLAGGRIDLLLGDLTAVGGLVQSGQIRVIAAASPERSRLAPDVPTINEATGLATGETGPWFGVFGPAGMPDEMVTRLNGEIRTYLSTAEAEAAFIKIGQVPLVSSSQELGALVRADLERFATIIREQNITLE